MKFRFILFFFHSAFFSCEIKIELISLSHDIKALRKEYKGAPITDPGTKSMQQHCICERSLLVTIYYGKVL